MSNDEKHIKTMFEDSSEIMLVMVVDITSFLEKRLYHVRFDIT